MTSRVSVPPVSATAEVLELIETLHNTERRLASLTSGQVDTVAAQDGRTMLLRRSQEYLRESDAARQIAILNALPAHIALLDARGMIMSANDAWSQFVCGDPAGHNLGHAVGVSYLDSCDNVRGKGEHDAHRTAEGIRTVLSGDVASFSMEWRCDTPTQERSFMLTVTPLEYGRQAGAVVMYVDVTAQRGAEQELRASELRFRQMAENVDEVFFLRALDGSRAFYISPAYERIWGRTCESFYQSPDSWMDAIHPYDRATIAEKHKAGVLAGKFEFEYRIVRPDGSVRWIASRGFPVRDESGTLVRIAGIAEDVTERIQGLDSLRESEMRYRALTDASFDAINVTQSGIVLEVNAGFEKMFGYENKEIIGRPAADFFIPESADTERQYAFANVDGRYDAVGTRNDGSKILLELTAKNHLVDGRLARLGALRDITAQRQLEEQFRQAQKLEAVGRLAAGVAHDFNNQLAVITAYASFLHDDLNAEDPKRGDIEEIQKAAAGAAALTRQLLTFSRQQVTAP